MRLQVLVDLITAIATGSGLTRGDGVLGQSPFDLPDDSGATPILALLVANTAPAISLCLQLYRARPELLAHSHAPGANNAFTGENAFHVAAVNRREDALCTMLELAHDGLDAATLTATLTSCAEGRFFEELPTRLYGGTPLA